jgi:hypothetical protein
MKHRGEEEGVDGTRAGRVDTVRLYLQKRMDRCTTRIAHARKAAAEPTPDWAGRGCTARPSRRPRGNTIQSAGGSPAAAEEVERVKSALAPMARGHPKHTS